jgi:hypothetical protein
MFCSTSMYALRSSLDAKAPQMKVSATLGLEPYPIVRSYGKLLCFVHAPCNNYEAPAQVRLEILLVKEAEQRSSDDIHPRIDQQLLGGDRTFGRYETLRRILVEFILTVCRLRYCFIRLISSVFIHRSHHHLFFPTEGATSATNYRLHPIRGSLRLT